MLNLLTKALPHQLLIGINEPPFSEAELQGFAKIEELEEELDENAKSAGSLKGQLLMMGPRYKDKKEQPEEPWDHNEIPPMDHIVSITHPKVFSVMSDLSQFKSLND